MNELPAAQAFGTDDDPAEAGAARGIGRSSETTDGSGTPTPIRPLRAAFAHESEAELARILDFYAVRWEYEPHTYPILWDIDGAVLESFSPDFYLPDLDMYLELTTLKQRLVRKKNRKLRRLRELYPDIRIKLFYARDFRMLMLKYGKLALVDALSGTPGQVVPPGRAVTADGSLPSDALDPDEGRRGAAGVAGPGAAGTGDVGTARPRSHDARTISGAAMASQAATAGPDTGADRTSGHSTSEGRPAGRRRRGRTVRRSGDPAAKAGEAAAS